RSQGSAWSLAAISIVISSVELRPIRKENVMSEDWRHHGVKIIPRDRLDANTPQTPGMTRAAAITHARTGASKIWAGTVEIHANAKTGPHHHGELESVIYIVSGKARMRWGEK